MKDRFSTSNSWMMGLALVAASGGVAMVAQSLYRRRQHKADDSPSSLQLGRHGQKEVAKKQYLASKHHQQAPKTVSNNKKHTPGAVPPGNFTTTKWIPTDLGLPLPSSWNGNDPDQWHVTLVHNGQTRKTITFADLQQLASWPTRVGPYSWHCVTGWTCHNLVFYGVLLQDVLDKYLIEQTTDNHNWQWLYQTSADGYTAPIHRDDLANAYLVVQVEEPQTGQQQSNNEQPAITNNNKQWLDRQHGGPRIIVESLWGWKSAKWLTKIELMTTYRPGFWESLGCHARGRVYNTSDNLYLQERWKQEGYWSTIIPVLTGMANVYHKIGGVDIYQTVLQRGGAMVGWIGTAFGFLQQQQHEKSN